MPRKWTNIKIFEQEILSMKANGKTRQEIADVLGLEKLQIKEFVKRHNRKLREESESLKTRGRPRKTPLTEHYSMHLRILELEREVEILRSFLHVTGRR